MPLLRQHCLLTMAFCLRVVVFCAFLNVSFAKPPKQEDFLNLIETLQSSFDIKIAMLAEQIGVNEKECERKLSTLEQRILHLETENQRLKEENSNNKREIISLWRIVTNMSKIIKRNSQQYMTGMRPSKKAHSLINHEEVDIHKYQPKYYRRTNRALDYSVNIAFTAYLDHDIVNLGRDQTLVFNRVLLNDGTGYNNYTGIFTTPVTGVYSISFFVGERDADEVRAYLVVNNQHKVDAATDPMHTHQDLQGGNTANLRLNKGDSVFITHQGGGKHVEGDNILRTTTFSAFLIYPIETTNIVGK